MRKRALGVALVLLVLAAPCCRQVGGVHELTAASELCASCTHASCAAETSACRAGSGSCDARASCELGCDPDDVDCRAACATSGVGEAIAPLEACAETACAGSCAGSCGDVLPIVPVESASSCAACIAIACCGEGSACGGSVECRASLECARTATAIDAINACERSRHPDGAAAYAALDQCIKGQCATECAYGGKWTCVGNVQQPGATAASITGTIRVVDASAQSQGIPGLEVRGCYITDEECAATPPVTATTVTDANGLATITLPTKSDLGQPGFQGYFEVKDPKGTYLTTLAIPGFALTEDGFVQSFIASSLAEAQTLAKAVNRTYDTSLGYAIVTSVDCADHPAPGVSFALESLGASSLVVYPYGGIPSLSTTSTDDSGVALAAFLPPGVGTLTATNSGGQLVSKTTYFTRANATSVVLVPVNQ